MTERASTASPPRASAKGLVGLALLLGVIGFGGGFAVAQRLRIELVQKRRWLDDASFVEHLSVATALPGTASTNLFTILGWRFGGVATALAAAAAFLAPSVALMIAFGAIYDRVRAIGALSAFLDGMSLATVGVVAAVAVEMRKAAVRARIEWILAVSTALLLVVGVLDLLEAVMISALVGVLFLRPPRRERAEATSFPPASLRAFAWLGAPIGTLGALFVTFARIGVATFGGGFAMIPAIERQVVQLHGWLSESAFTDAMVLGQITPGPVAIASTFIGFRVAGALGAAAATAGMFGPPFVLSVAAAHSVHAFRENRSVQGLLRGVAPAVVGVIAAASVSLARSAVRGPFDAVVALVSFAILVAWPKLPPIVVLAAGGAAALARHLA